MILESINRITHPSQESADLVIERNKAEMFLKIVGFRVEVKEKELATSWENATVINFPPGKTAHQRGSFKLSVYVFLQLIHWQAWKSPCEG